MKQPPLLINLGIQIQFQGVVLRLMVSRHSSTKYLSAAAPIGSSCPYRGIRNWWNCYPRTYVNSLKVLLHLSFISSMHDLVYSNRVFSSLNRRANSLSSWNVNTIIIETFVTLFLAAKWEVSNITSWLVDLQTLNLHETVLNVVHVLWRLYVRVREIFEYPVVITTERSLKSGERESPSIEAFSTPSSCCVKTQLGKNPTWNIVYIDSSNTKHSKSAKNVTPTKFLRNMKCEESLS